MKDLLEKIIRLIPAYLDEFFSLVSGPKRFMATKIQNNELTIDKALIFMVVSFSIGWILEVSWLRRDPLLEFGADIIFIFIYTLMYGVALYIAWYIVGGRSEFKKFLTIHFYFSSIIKLLFSFTFLGMMGAFKIIDPILFKDFIDSIYNGTNFTIFLRENPEILSVNIGFKISMLIFCLGMGFIVAWIIVGWGAYREFNKLSRLRSVVASFLFLLFCLPVMTLTSFIAFSLIK